MTGFASPPQLKSIGPTLCEILFILVDAATCISWSPKGKQLAVGALSGAIARVDQTGKQTFLINPPPKHQNMAGMYLRTLSDRCASFVLEHFSEYLC